MRIEDLSAKMKYISLLDISKREQESKNIGNLNTSLSINKISNRTLELEWINPIDVISSNSFNKIGLQNIPSRNESGVVLQIAGSCLVGSNNVGDLNSSYLRNNSLIVCGSIYSTTDISTDSDISYKYNLKIILDIVLINFQINIFKLNLVI